MVNGITTVGKTFRVVCTVKDGEDFLGWFDVKKNEVTARLIRGELMRDKYYVEENGNEYTLVIQNVAVTDGGNYTCKGNMSESTFTLFIECKYLLMYYQFATFMFLIMQFFFSKKCLRKYCFQFLLGLMISFEKLKHNFCKIL